MLTKLGLIFLAVQTAAPSATNKNCTDAGQDMTYIGQVTKGLLVKLKTEPTGEDIIVKLQLFTAATTDRRKAAAAVAAAGAMSRCRRRATTAMTEAASTVGGQLAGLSFHFGRHTALAALTNAKIKAAVRQTFSGGAKILSIQLDSGSKAGLEQSKCTPTEYAKHGGNPEGDAKHAKQQIRMSVVTAKAARDANDAGQAQACATDGSCGSTGAASGVEIKAGPLYTAQESKHHSNEANGDLEKLTIYVSTEDQADQLRQLDSEARQQLTTATPTKIDCRPWETIDDEELLKDVTAKNNGGTRPETITATEVQKAQKAVKDLFGSQESEWKEKFWNAVEEQEVNTGKTGQQAKAKIGAISGLTNLDAALTATHMQKLLTATATSQAKDTTKEAKTEKPEEPKKTADECKKHKTSEDCKKETGCDFDDKKDPKCFPKVEASKKDERSFCSNVRVSVSQIFAAFAIFVVS